MSESTKPKCHKTKRYWTLLVVWTEQTKINIWNWVLKAIFYFLTRNKVSLQANICRSNSLNPPESHFSHVSLFKIWKWTLPAPEEWDGEYWVGFFLIYFTLLTLSVLRLIFHSHNRVFRLSEPILVDNYVQLLHVITSPF